MWKPEPWVLFLKLKRSRFLKGFWCCEALPSTGTTKIHTMESFHTRSCWVHEEAASPQTALSHHCFFLSWAVTWLTSAGMEAASTSSCCGESSGRLPSLPATPTAAPAPLPSTTATRTRRSAEPSPRPPTPRPTACARASSASYHGRPPTGTPNQRALAATALLPSPPPTRQRTRVAASRRTRCRRGARTPLLGCGAVASGRAADAPPPCPPGVTASCWTAGWIFSAAKLQAR